MVAEIVDFDEAGQDIREGRVLGIAEKILDNDGVFIVYDKQEKELYQFNLCNQSLSYFIKGFCGIIYQDDYQDVYLILEDMLEHEKPEEDFDSLEFIVEGKAEKFTKLQATLFCVGVAHAYNYVVNNRVCIEV